MKNSEFGKGFVYCIGLFIMHVERNIYENDYSMWFNGAADHLYEIEIPKNLPDNFKTKINKWVDKCIKLRLNFASKLDFEIAIGTAKEILIEYDKFCGIDAIKADYE